jgi:hypothetical protein
MTIDKVKQTIADLLNLARNDAATQGEIDNAMRFARRLMDAHHLSEDDCKTQQNQPQAMSWECGEKPIYGYNTRFMLWEVRLAQFIEKFVGSVGIYRDNEIKLVFREGEIQGAPKQALVYYGPLDDVQLAADLYDKWYHVIITMAKLRIGHVVRGLGRSYCEGFVAGMFTTLEQVKLADQSSNQQTNALIVRSTEIAAVKKTAAQNYITAKFGKMGKGKKMKGRGVDAGAYSQGKIDGARAEVSATRREKAKRIS